MDDGPQPRTDPINFGEDPDKGDESRIFHISR